MHANRDLTMSPHTALHLANMGDFRHKYVDQTNFLQVSENKHC